MSKMWAGVTDGTTSKIADDFNSSIKFDRRMYVQDIQGSIAHATMLGLQGIINKCDADKIVDGLSGILDDISSGALKFDDSAEDVHMFIEQVLTDRIGDVGKKLHTARSRNDQVALDFRMYLREETDAIIDLTKLLIGTLCDKAEEYKDTVMPGYTHLQRAQPITFGQHLSAYAMMLLRDAERFTDTKKRLNISPIGSCALSGTTFPIDREFEAKQLGFDGVSQNSIDGVSDRDFSVEFACNCAIIMMHLSRFAEELILWSSWEFGFIELSDSFTTGSSIMPQKKNPDMAELVRGKTGRVYGNLIGILTVLKGLPLAYNKDMQEDKESAFDNADTVKACLNVFIPMIKEMKAIKSNMKSAAQKGFINATDLADYLVKKGLPFRSAYKISGQIVKKCIEEDKVLETLSIEEYKLFSDLFDVDVYDEISLENCINKRISFGGTSVKSVATQIQWVRSMLGK